MNALVNSFRRNFDGVRFTVTLSVAAIVCLVAIYDRLPLLLTGADVTVAGY